MLNKETILRVIRRYPLRNWMICYLTDLEYARIRDETGLIRGRLIDIGCGDKPYKGFWGAGVSEHVGIDHGETLHDPGEVDVYCSAYEIPFDDESFDCAICTATLEHLEEPELALRECHRLLRKGGIAVFSAPFIWHLHEEPRDFYRFSRYGIAYLFEKTGFEVMEVKALAGFWVTFGQALIYYLYRFNRGLIARTRLVDALALLIQVTVFTLDRIDRAEEWSWMHIAVARKI